MSSLLIGHPLLVRLSCFSRESLSRLPASRCVVTRWSHRTWQYRSRMSSAGVWVPSEFAGSLREGRVE